MVERISQGENIGIAACIRAQHCSPDCCLFCFERPLPIRALHAYSNSCHLEGGGDETTLSYAALNHDGNKLCRDQTNSASLKRYGVREDGNRMGLRKDVSAADKPSS